MHFLLIVSFLTSVLLSFILTRYVRNLAVSRGWVATPDLTRHIHSDPVPRLGGVAIFVSFSTVVALVLASTLLFEIDLGFSPLILVYLAASGMIVFLLGVYDDVRTAGPYLKLGVQSLAAAWLYFEGFQVLHLPFLFGDRDFGWLGLPLTILWMLLITNAFNLIDGLDGLASGSALFTTLTIFAIALVSGNQLVALMTVVLAGAILGFLKYYFNPATIFLGDCGSLFIGFILGALALAGSYKTPTVVAVAIPVISFGLPIMETLLSIIRRFMSGQPLFSGDREHIHHKLLERGLSHKQVVVLLYGVSAVLGILSLLLLYPGSATLGVVLFVLGAGIWVAVQQLGYHEFFEIKRVANRTIEQKRIIVNNLAIRRASSELEKAGSPAEVCRILKNAFQANDFDGFDLNFHHPYTHLCCAWSKSNRYEEPDASPTWNLSLELLRENQQQIGSFVLRRAHNDKPLMVDINLVVSELHFTLTGAINRALAALEAPQKGLAVGTEAGGLIPDLSVSLPK
jgi:UDP-GlcNAc:undecaprenyl-phosphate GlcNAc-1-phosphate transferase